MQISSQNAALYLEDKTRGYKEVRRHQPKVKGIGIGKRLMPSVF